VLYFLVQAVAVVLWWVALAIWPAARPWFLPGTSIDPAFAAFAGADLLVLAPLSAVTSWLAASGRSWAPVAAWLTTGAVCYSAAYTVVWTPLVGAPVLSPLAMIAAAAGSVTCARRVV
jgi:hypothetical protein